LQKRSFSRLIASFRWFIVNGEAGVDEETVEREVGWLKAGLGSEAMRPKASTGPPRTDVQRQFDANRLGEDCQARAYEQVLPVVRRPLIIRTDIASQTMVFSEHTEASRQGGVAA
jgi:hypothetical protein